MSAPAKPTRTPPIASGLRQAWQQGYGLADLRRDLLAGLTVGTVAVPLSMALAIATGVPPQHGLYTAIVAAAIIALTGGSRFNISGPTAAFVVILFPIVQQYGLGGLLLATMMAGAILVALGLTRLGRLIEFVPYPVVLGFTAGIAVVIAVMQIPDFLGLATGPLSEHFVENVYGIFTALPSIHWPELAVGAFTLAVMLVWTRWRLPVPAPLIGLIVGALAAYALNHGLSSGNEAPLVQTIASRFQWEAGGVIGSGIPPIPPAFSWGWLLPGPDGQPLDLNFALFRSLLGPACAIALLGAIESLLCAVIADGMTQTKHDPDAELVGQGLGNLIAPLFGGITATAAIARTATSVRSGARSPIAALIHAGVVLLAVVMLADLLGYVPMAALAALLFVVAWNMSEARHFGQTLRSAPRGDVAILLICFALTVLFDMVLAVGVGVALAAALFIRRMALLTHTAYIDTRNDTKADIGWPDTVALYDVNGPLFFGVTEKALTSLRLVDSKIRVMVIDLHDVPSIDGTALVALQALASEMERNRVGMVFVGARAGVLIDLRRAGIHKVPGKRAYCRSLGQAQRLTQRWLSVSPQSHVSDARG